MEKAIYSKVNLKTNEQDIAKEYVDTIYDIVDEVEVQKLKEYTQHMKTSRFQHSLNVSYYSFLLARKLGCDQRSAARAGLLHDLYYYDWKTNDERPMEGNHAKVHPQVALENAQLLTEINDVEADAIVHHMWPLTSRPHTKEGWIIQAMDKYCALLEIFSQLSNRASYSKHLNTYLMLMMFVITR